MNEIAGTYDGLDVRGDMTSVAIAHAGREGELRF